MTEPDDSRQVGCSGGRVFSLCLYIFFFSENFRRNLLTKLPKNFVSSLLPGYAGFYNIDMFCIICSAGFVFGEILLSEAGTGNSVIESPGINEDEMSSVFLKYFL